MLGSTLLSPSVISPYPSGFRHNRPQQLTVPTGYATGFANGATLTMPGAQQRKQETQILWPWEIAGKSKIDYLVAMFHGRRGKGKSTGATAFAKFLLQGNQNVRGSKYKVYANYKVNFADMCHPRLIDWLVTFPEELHDCFILVDEIAVYFPSVRATTTVALNFSTFLQEIRKLRVELIFTTQFPTFIVGATNIQVDLFVEPTLYNKVYSPTVKQWVADKVRLDCVDWWGQWTGNPIQHRWPPMDQDVVCSPTLTNLKAIYPDYNTDEVIPAFWSPNRDDVLERQWQDDVAKEEAEALQRLEQLKQLRDRHAPKEKPKATTMEMLLEQMDSPVNLSEVLKDAMKIDPMIKKYADLAAYLRRHGWSCYQDGGKYGPWFAERIPHE